MMKKICTLDQAIQTSEHVRRKGKTIVLAGGCFDILHTGHRAFLEKSKEHGDALFILLESDETINQLKGPGRPVNSQQQRAEALAQLSYVDCIVLLPHLTTNEQYDRVVLQLKPAIITTTKHDSTRRHKERQAHLLGINVVDVIERLTPYSTTHILHNKENYEH